MVAVAPLHAQYVGLNKKEIKELQRWRKGRDSIAVAVGKAYDMQAQTADRALEEAPHPIDTIRTEGLLAGDPKKTATQQSLRDMNKIYALALVYRVSGDRKYLEKAKEFLQAWARTNHPKGDPIDDTNLDRAIEAYDMVKQDLPRDENAVIVGWLRNTAQTELGGRYYHPERPSHFNNWHSHRLKIVGEIAFAIGDTALQTYTINGLKTQLEKNLNPDGSSIDFTSRDALHYHVYDLEPLLKLITVLERATGVNYYSYVSPTGSSIRKSVDWLIPFVDGTKTHAEFVNSTVDFDRKRAQNNEAAYKAGTLFEPKSGLGTLVLAAYFDASLLPLAKKLFGEEAGESWQGVVILLMRDK